MRVTVGAAVVLIGLDSLALAQAPHPPIMVPAPPWQVATDENSPVNGKASKLEQNQNEYKSVEFLEWSNRWMSDSVEYLNDGVDSFFMNAFFDDEVIADQSSGSSGRIYFISRREQADNPDYQIGANLRLTLPNTRDRFKLLIETDESGEDQIENNILRTTENVTYSTALRVDLEPRKNWRTSIDNGVRWAGEPVYFSRIRLRRVDYHDYWRTRFYHSISWRTDEEWGSFMSMTGLMPLDLYRQFSVGVQADYLLKEDFADLEASAAIFDELSYRAAMLYQIRAIGNTQYYGKVNDYVASISYRRKLYKSFVFAELTPELGWPRDRDYKTTPALTFTLELIFGPEHQ